MQNENRHILSLTHHDLQSSQIVHQWFLAALYESTSWVSSVIKIKASKVVPGARILKVDLKILHLTIKLRVYIREKLKFID